MFFKGCHDGLLRSKRYTPALQRQSLYNMKFFITFYHLDGLPEWANGSWAIGIDPFKSNQGPVTLVTSASVARIEKYYSEP
jgi:hypothetical protein